MLGEIDPSPPQRVWRYLDDLMTPFGGYSYRTHVDAALPLEISEASSGFGLSMFFPTVRCSCWSSGREDA